MKISKIIPILLLLAGACFDGDLLQGPEASNSFQTEAQGVAESALSSASVTITWTTISETTHLIEYGISSGTYTLSTQQSSTASASHSVTLSGLTAGTTYYYRVKNFHGTYPDSVSAERTFSTTGDTPPTLAQKLRGIWMVGGLSGSNHTTVVGALDLFDPLTNTWYPAVATLPTPVSFAGTTSIKISGTDHRIYVFGGFDNAGLARNLVQYYTIETNTWSTGTVIPNNRVNIYAARIYNKIYILGGNANDATVAWTGQTTTYEYTPASDSWVTTKTAFGAAGSERFPLVFNDTIYNMGGRTAFATIGGTHDGFVVSWGANGTLSTGITEIPLTTAPSVARTGLAGDMYVPSNGPAMMITVGGFNTMGKTATATSVIQNTNANLATNLVQYLAYPFSGTGQVWVSATTAYPASLGFGSAVVYYSESLTPNYRLYFFGGTTSIITAAGTVSARWCDLPPLPPATWNNTWTGISDMPTARYGFSAVQIQQ